MMSIKSERSLAAERKENLRCFSPGAARLMAVANDAQNAVHMIRFVFKTLSRQSRVMPAN